MTYSVRNIVVALGTAVAAAALVLVYTTSFKEQVTQNQERVKVLVAGVEIPAGTPAEKAAGMMTPREVVAADKTPGALTDTTVIAGKVATQTIYPGQQVVREAFQPAITQEAQYQLTRTQRGVRVELNLARGVLGPVRPGDTVDVFGTFDVEVRGSNDDVTVTRLLMKDVRVLEAPEIAAEDAAEEDIAKKHVVMLAVDQQQAAKLAFMAADDTNRKLQLVVRPPADQAAEMPVALQTVETMIMDGLTLPEIRRRVPGIGGVRAAGRTGQDTDEQASRAATAGS